MPDIPASVVRQIPVEKIEPSPTQARKDFDPNDLKALAESIRARGQIDPIHVRPTSDGYELIDGERRLRAIQSIGLPTIKALIDEIDPKEAALRGVVANAQRKDLNPIERAISFKCLSEEFNLSQNEIATLMGFKDGSLVANFMSLLKLPPEVQALLSRESISEGHCRYLNRIKDQNQLLKTAKQASEKGWSIKETEKRVNQLLGKPQEANKPSETSVKPTPEVQSLISFYAKLAKGWANRGDAQWGASYGRHPDPNKEGDYGKAWHFWLMDDGSPVENQLADWLMRISYATNDQIKRQMGVKLNGPSEADLAEPDEPAPRVTEKSAPAPASAPTEEPDASVHPNIPEDLDPETAAAVARTLAKGRLDRRWK